MDWVYANVISAPGFPSARSFSLKCIDSTHLSIAVILMDVNITASSPEKCMLRNLQELNANFGCLGLNGTFKCLERMRFE